MGDTQRLNTTPRGVELYVTGYPFSNKVNTLSASEPRTP